MHTLDTFFADARTALSYLDTWVITARPPARADHLCYKCSTREEFESIRALFEIQSSFIYQSIISGRRIAIIRFLEPIPTQLGDVWFLELSDQKPDGSQVSGFDHVELYPTGGSPEDLVHALTEAGTDLQKIIRPHHTTYDAVIHDTFKIRLEAEPLVQTIMHREMWPEA